MTLCRETMTNEQRKSVANDLASGEIGELMVRGPVVTERYVTGVEANALHKVRDGESHIFQIQDFVRVVQP